MMNGCEFLRKKGEELNWDHHKLFRYFKLQIEPYTKGLKETCNSMLQFYHSIKTANIQLTPQIEQNYELFMDIYHYQHFIDVSEEIIPPIEVQLMWIVHSLDPVEYYKDCYRKYKKLLDVKILSLYTYTNTQIHTNECQFNQEIPYLSEFEHYVNSKINTNIFSPMCSVLTTNSMYTNNSGETSNTWFIRNLHMKKSIIQQIEFINKINYISKFNTFNDRNLYKSIHRYFKFLYLMALPMDKRPPICIPTIDVDLIWHAHILNINNYHLMSKLLFPFIDIIPHNHSMPNILQKQNKQITEIFWDKIFGGKDYLNGRPFYIISHQKINTNERRKIIRNDTPKQSNAPKAPIALTLDITPSASPELPSNPVKIIRVQSEPMKIENESDTKTVSTEISTKMLMDSRNEGNCSCFWPCMLCKDCCLWSFSTHKRANIGIICCITVFVILLLTLFGALIFIPNETITNSISINLYQNNIIINKDFITIYSKIEYDIKDNIFNDNEIIKSIAYEIDGENNDFIGFNGGNLVKKPYVNDDYYYVDIDIENNEIDNNKNVITYNYSLSLKYLCCNNFECDEIGLLMPWINKWEYPSNVKIFNMNVFYNNNNNNENDNLISIYSSWDGYNYNAQNRIFNLWMDKIDINNDLNVYFKLLFSNDSNMEYLELNNCSKQFDYFVYDNSFEFKEEDSFESIMTLFDFVLISLSTIIFMICFCYACWWIMYLFDKSFCCDLCNVILM